MKYNQYINLIEKTICKAAMDGNNECNVVFPCMEVANTIEQTFDLIKILISKIKDELIFNGYTFIDNTGLNNKRIFEINFFIKW